MLSTGKGTLAIVVIHGVLRNHTKTHEGRCKSFITDTRGGGKIVVQQQQEPIRAELL